MVESDDGEYFELDGGTPDRTDSATAKLDDDELTAALFGMDTASRAGTTHATCRWRDLDQRTAGKAWGQLDHWVRWFVATYKLTTSVVPDCWWRHSEIVAELYALQQAELASFTVEDSGFGPISLHERLPLAVERLRLHTRTAGCVGLQVHKESEPRVLPPDGPEFKAWVTEPHQLSIGS